MSLLSALIHGALLASSTSSFDWTPWVELVFAVGLAGIALIVIYSKRNP